MQLPSPGFLIAGKYRLEAQLGEGGMGAVFRARHELMDKQVALKWLKPRPGDERAARTRFMTEARAAARIRHPNVVDVYDIGEHEGALFMVMELLEGETLATFMERAEAPLSETIRHLISAMRGVAAAHAVGITHRDIKPENVFIAYDSVHTDGVAKVLDFGISKLQGGTTQQLTMPGVAMGTPQFMSFEQLCGQVDIDRRADVYAFGVLLYLAFTGVLPYDGSSMGQIIVQASAGVARRPQELRVDLPRELDRIVMKAMARRREDRFDTLELLIEALQGARVPRGSQSFPASPSRTVALSTPRVRTLSEISARQLPSLRPTASGSLVRPLAGLAGAAVGLALSFGLYTLATGDEPRAPAAAPAKLPPSLPTIEPQASAPQAPAPAKPPEQEPAAQPVTPAQPSVARMAQPVARPRVARVPPPVVETPPVVTPPAPVTPVFPTNQRVPRSGPRGPGDL